MQGPGPVAGTLAFHGHQPPDLRGRAVGLGGRAARAGCTASTSPRAWHRPVGRRLHLRRPRVRRADPLRHRRRPAAARRRRPLRLRPRWSHGLTATSPEPALIAGTAYPRRDQPISSPRSTCSTVARPARCRCPSSRSVRPSGSSTASSCRSAAAASGASTPPPRPRRPLSPGALRPASRRSAVAGSGSGWPRTSRGSAHHGSKSSNVSSISIVVVAVSIFTRGISSDSSVPTNTTAAAERERGAGAVGQRLGQHAVRPPGASAGLRPGRHGGVRSELVDGRDHLGLGRREAAPTPRGRRLGVVAPSAR